MWRAAACAAASNRPRDPQSDRADTPQAAVARLSLRGTPSNGNLK
jgi:hypothetical protein